MNGNYIIDTNIIIGFLPGDSYIMENVRKYQNVYVPIIVIGELFFGAYKSKNTEKNPECIQKLISNIPIIFCDLESSKYYGLLKNKLKQKGKPIPENDIRIAAVTIQHNFILVTKDVHFYEIDGLAIEKW